MGIESELQLRRRCLKKYLGKQQIIGQWLERIFSCFEREKTRASQSSLQEVRLVVDIYISLLVFWWQYLQIDTDKVSVPFAKPARRAPGASGTPELRPAGIK